MLISIALVLLACSPAKRPGVAESPAPAAPPEKGLIYTIVPEQEDDDPFMKLGEGCDALKACCAEMKRLSHVAGVSCYDIATREGSCPELMAEAVKAFTSWEALAGTRSGPVPAACTP